MNGYKNEFEIYADNEEEAVAGRNALVSFVEMMRQCGVAVRGNKLNEAVNQLGKNSFIKGQIVNFFK